MTDEQQMDCVRADLAKLEAVRNMTQHEGWKIVVDHFNKTLAVIQRQLTQAQKYEDIVRLQERHRAFEAMLQAVDSMYTLCDSYRDHLKELELETQMKQQYGLNS